jgi:hypothetical protein
VTHGAAPCALIVGRNRFIAPLRSFWAQIALAYFDLRAGINFSAFVNRFISLSRRPLHTKRTPPLFGYAERRAVHQS